LERSERVSAIAREIVKKLPEDLTPRQSVMLDNRVKLAAMIAKADLLTDMVGEFPELQGIMGRYYALADGFHEEVANAVEDHYKPRFAGDALPRGRVGMIVALADKLETLTGMFGIGQTPTGDKDPFALRRHALGVIRILTEGGLNLPLNELLDFAFEVVAPGGKTREAAVRKSSSAQDVSCQMKESCLVDREACQKLSSFIFDRLAVNLREQGYTAQEVDAVLSLTPQLLSDIPKRLAAVRAFAALPEAEALAAANKRVGNILKKAVKVKVTKPKVTLLKEPAEKALSGALNRIVPEANAAFEAGDYCVSLQTLAALRESVDEFFDKVMVNVEDPKLRANRLTLLAQLHGAMNRVADLSRLSA
jgi:glycyl-tRNA synthetase beta chain